MSENCPSCGNPSETLLKVDVGKKVALGLTYDEVCATCYEALPSKVSQGMKLRQEEEMKKKNKVKLWKGRVDLIKKARSYMKSKGWTEAAINYEKYIKVLELIYDLPANGLTPEVFSNDSRSKELTIVVTVYWDLLRIYDQSPRTHERMENAANKLALFAPYSGILPDIAKKAESFSRSAKNPKPVKEFLKEIRQGRSGCFIATAAFHSRFSPEVVLLRAFRDQQLMTTKAGQAFVQLYYKISPPLARLLNRHHWLKPPVRVVLRLFIRFFQK